jgi:hypothetical protein
MKKLAVLCADLLGEIALAMVLDDYGIDDYEIPEAQTEGAVKAAFSEERGKEKAAASAQAHGA